MELEIGIKSGPNQNHGNWGVGPALTSCQSDSGWNKALFHSLYLDQTKDSGLSLYTKTFIKSGAEIQQWHILLRLDLSLGDKRAFH